MSELIERLEARITTLTEALTFLSNAESVYLRAGRAAESTMVVLTGRYVAECVAALADAALQPTPTTEEPK